MTNETSSVTSDEELNEALKALLIRAYENDVDVEGGWECRNGMDHPDWDVLVTEVVKPDDGADS